MLGTYTILGMGGWRDTKGKNNPNWKCNRGDLKDARYVYPDTLINNEARALTPLSKKCSIGIEYTNAILFFTYVCDASTISFL